MTPETHSKRKKPPTPVNPTWYGSGHSPMRIAPCSDLAKGGSPPSNDGDKPARARREPRHDARWAVAGFSGAGGVTGAWNHERNPNPGISKEPRGAGRLQQLVRQRLLAGLSFEGIRLQPKDLFEPRGELIELRIGHACEIHPDGLHIRIPADRLHKRDREAEARERAKAH